jgi:hypothetical protein
MQAMNLTACSNYQPAAFSFLGNDAVLAHRKNISAGVYSERRFLMEGVNHFLGMIVLPVHTGSFGFALNRIGSPEFHESTMGISYGLKITGSLDIGARFNIRNENYKGYGKSTDLGYGLAAMIRPLDKLNTGVRITRSGNNSSVSWSWNIGYDVSKIFHVGLEIEKKQEQETGFHAGCSYLVAPALVLQAGISNQSMVWMACSLRLKKFTVNFFNGYHLQLGFTPGLGLQFDFKSGT